MFIDINAYIGHWPFRPLENNTLCGLDKLAREYGITHMIVANLNGLFYKDANNANRELLEELKSYNGKTEFIPFAMVNPSYAGWERNAREMIKQGFKGFEISPLYHGYSTKPLRLFDGDGLTDYPEMVFKLADELGVPVRICASFENYRGRCVLDVQENIKADDLFAMLSKYPNVPTYATSFNTLEIGGPLAELVKNRKNIFFDTTQTGMLASHPAVLARVSEDQLCFGSLSPFCYIDTNLVRIEMCPALNAENIKANGAKGLKL